MNYFFVVYDPVVMREIKNCTFWCEKEISGCSAGKEKSVKCHYYCICLVRTKVASIREQTDKISSSRPMLPKFLMSSAILYPNVTLAPS